jgi:hypothetical protein
LKKVFSAPAGLIFILIALCQVLQGMKSEFADPGFVVYPNPACKFLQTKGTAPFKTAEAEIRNLSGVLVKKVPYTVAIDISDLIPAIYFISLKESSHGKTWNTRFIKQ